MSFLSRGNRESARFCDGFCANLITPHEEEDATSPSDDFASSEGFVGRNRELTELKAGLEGSLSGHGMLVMMTGKPGIGKTRIPQELASHAESRDAQVFWGWRYEEEGAPPYWPWV